MNKKIGIMILFIGILFSGCDTGPKFKHVSLVYPSVGSQKTEPKIFWAGNSDLRKSFERYWSLRFDKQISAKDLLLTESPYFQEMVDESQYNVYIRGGVVPDLLEIQLQQLVKQTDSLYRIDCRVWFKRNGGEKQEMFIEDQWVCVKGKWYHVLKDMLFLPAVS